MTNPTVSSDQVACPAPVLKLLAAATPAGLVGSLDLVALGVAALPEATLRGITLRGLRKLIPKIQQLVALGHFKGVSDWKKLTTADFVYQWVKPCTGTDRLADFADWVDPADLGRPSHFISHAWAGLLWLLLTQTLDTYRNAPESTVVWIDIIAMNQHKDTCLEVNRGAGKGKRFPPTPAPAPSNAEKEPQKE